MKRLTILLAALLAAPLLWPSVPPTHSAAPQAPTPKPTLIPNDVVFFRWDVQGATTDTLCFHGPDRDHGCYPSILSGNPYTLTNTYFLEPLTVEERADGAAIAFYGPWELAGTWVSVSMMAVPPRAYLPLTMGK